MEIKGFIYLPKDEVKDPEAVIAWITNANEQGGYHRTLEEAKVDRHSNDKRWELVPVSFIVSEPIFD